MCLRLEKDRPSHRPIFVGVDQQSPILVCYINVKTQNGFTGWPIQEGVKGKKETFAGMDTDGDGFITIHELRYAMHRADPKVTEDMVQKRFTAMDKDGDGNITKKEFFAARKSQNH